LEQVEIYGCPVDNLSFEETLDRLVEIARGTSPKFVVTPNVDHLILLKRDSEFHAAYQDASLRVADGMPLLWAARLLRQPLKDKVSGSDVVPALCARAAQEGLSVYFLGGGPGAAEVAAEGLVEKNPGLEVAGTLCPPFGFHRDPDQNGEVIETVRQANPRILFVALGAPKQELWMHEHREALGVPLSIGIGASIDFEAGVQKRAPRWMQRSGFEWVYRLARDPVRMGKRYLGRDLPFVGYFFGLALRRCWPGGPKNRNGSQADSGSTRET